MNDFVGQCTREWQRLGVPTAAASEMAAELAADLAEAEADGVNAEEVLGNGVFDPRAFAAAWATARDLIPRPAPPQQPHSWARSAVPIIVAGASVLVMLVGVALAARSHATVGMIASRKVVPSPLLPPDGRVLGPDSSDHILGLVVVMIGLIGFAVAVAVWKPWKKFAVGHPDSRVTVDAP